MKEVYKWIVNWHKFTWASAQYGDRFRQKYGTNKVLYPRKVHVKELVTEGYVYNAAGGDAINGSEKKNMKNEACRNKVIRYMGSENQNGSVDIKTKCS